MRVDFDPRRAEALVRAELLRRLDRIGRACVAHARRLCPRDTGRLADSITYVVDPEAMTVRFGTDLLYGRFVELGTHRMGPRSYVRRTALELADRIVALAGGG